MQYVNRVFTMRITLVLAFLNHEFGPYLCTYNPQRMHASGEVRHPDTGRRMDPTARCVDHGKLR